MPRTQRRNLVERIEQSRARFQMHLRDVRDARIAAKHLFDPRDAGRFVLAKLQFD